MILRVALIGLSASVLLATPVHAQMTLEEAREQGRLLGNEKRQDDTLVPTDNARAEAVPGYAGTTLPEGDYFDHPEKMESDAAAARLTNEQYRITTDADRSRPTFSNAEILATTSRATAVENDPSTYLAGENYDGTSGSCSPLPPASGTDGYYETSCNTGSKVTTENRTCAVNLDVRTEIRSTYTYYAGRMSTMPQDGGVYPALAAFDDEIAAGVCRETRAIEYCDNFGPFGYTPASSCRNLGHSAVELKCTAPAAGISPGYYHSGIVVATGQYWLSQADEPVATTVTRNEGLCRPFAEDSACTLKTETCTSSEPITRVVNGVAVTQPCWAWERSYECNRVSSGHNDCGTLEANASCSFVRTECLDEDNDGSCSVQERIYRCPTPGGAVSDAKQYICGGDVYCINGDCEPIVREASTEFKDALVALHSIDRAGKEFDETNFTVFTGDRETCHKPVFGLINCCAGKASGVLTAGAGAAALAGGPAAIAALATPFLAMFACSQDEMKLDIKDRMGFCHKVGTYCSSSFLGICKTKRTAYCCFESKLSRILQEQGRVQLGRPWGAPKKEQCLGFTIDEFARLDLSVMDFTEVYAEFVDAARLPDEVEAMTQIQQKIEDYYDLHGK